jgi:hypothetical protein
VDDIGADRQPPTNDGPRENRLVLLGDSDGPRENHGTPCLEDGEALVCEGDEDLDRLLPASSRHKMPGGRKEAPMNKSIEPIELVCTRT